MIEVRDDGVRHRYEALEDGVLVGFVQYRHPATGADGGPGTVRNLIHTETLEGFEGRGVAGALARGALDDIRARGFTVIPTCPFMASYIESHPAYQDLVEP